MKIGKLIIKEDIEFNSDIFNEIVLSEKYDLVYVYKKHNLLNYEKSLKSNLELIDIQINMSKKFSRELYLRQPYTFITHLTEKETNECYSISEKTSIVSRFCKDKKINPELVKKLYRLWIDNTINKTYSDGLFIIKQNEKIEAIHLIKTDTINRTGYFTLTGVNPNLVRMNLGSNLWLQSFGYWANEHNIEIVKSAFSLQNLNSFNFHLKMGFDKIEEINYIYHYHNI